MQVLKKGVNISKNHTDFSPIQFNRTLKNKTTSHRIQKSPGFNPTYFHNKKLRNQRDLQATIPFPL